MLMWLIGLFNPLKRILSTIERADLQDTERERIKTEALTAYVNAQAQVLTGRGWWFPAVFILPLGIWWTSVILYSIFWCRACAFPQNWTIAALPPPLDEWSGAIVASLFIGKSGEAIIARWRR